MTSPKRPARATPKLNLPPSKRLAEAELTGLIDTGIEQALQTALKILGDPHAAAYTRMAAAKFFHAPMMNRLGTELPDEAVSPQERFMVLMASVRNVPAREIIVTEDDIETVPVDDLALFEPDAESDTATA